MRKLTRTLHKIFSPSGKGLGEKGFTLIELLVVVGILGALAAVVVLNVGTFIGRGACEGYCTEKHNMQTAIIAYMAENGGTVPGWDDLDDYLVTGPKFTWTDVTIGDDGEIQGDAASPPTDCRCLEPAD